MVGRFASGHRAERAAYAHPPDGVVQEPPHPRSLRVLQGGLESSRCLHRAAGEPLLATDAPPVEREPHVASCLLENRSRRLPPRHPLLDRHRAGRVELEVRLEDRDDRAEDGVLRLPRLDEHLPHRRRVTGLVQGGVEVRREREARLIAGREEICRSPQERAAGGEVAAVEGAAAGGSEMAGGTGGEVGELRIAGVELRAVAVGLLEVVADDLVALDELVRREPVGEALVELGPGCLRERLVGGIADQQVPEAERVVAREGRLVGPDELLAHER